MLVRSKRISGYAKTMNPCRLLRDPMREIDTVADFENVINRFVEWRDSYDDAVRAGRIAPLVDEATPEAA